MALYHFSEDPGIEVFEPRPLAVTADRPAGQDWLNGPLVWGIEAAYEFLYFFPRDCPRIVVWPLADSRPKDVARWLREVAAGEADAVAHVEAAWQERLAQALFGA